MKGRIMLVYRTGKSSVGSYCVLYLFYIVQSGLQWLYTIYFFVSFGKKVSFIFEKMSQMWLSKIIIIMKKKSGSLSVAWDHLVNTKYRLSEHLSASKVHDVFYFFL